VTVEWRGRGRGVILPTVDAAPTPRLAALLHGGGRWTTFEHHATVDSTNARAAAHVRAGGGAGLVVVADRQTAGRGRLGRRWEDRPGGSLLVSAVVSPPPGAVTLVPLAAGLAAADAVAAAGAPGGLKWPNDVLVGGRKCGGILTEVVAPADGGAEVVIGVGVNVDWRGAPRDRVWTSVGEEAGEGADVDRWEVLADLLAALDRRLDTLVDGGALLDEYRRACVTLGRRVQVTLPHGVLVGVARDVDADGALLLRTGSSAAVLRVSSADVEHVRDVT
jgi:BirA family biotin operon repressor/biotin-[acetyl-CoA-carboxylase] ligase